MGQPTEAQRRASRQNALSSTGPRTIAGKNISRLNGQTHGLASLTTAAVARKAPTLGARLAAWSLAYPPRSAAEHALMERAVVASVQRQRCVIACHTRLLVEVEKGDPVAAIVGDSEHALYFRYEQMHDQEMCRALGALLRRLKEPVAVAPDDADEPGCTAPYGYY
jgi:hypothetical protein